MSQLPDRLASIRQRIANAAEKAGRKPGEIGLVAVSKTQPPEALQEAWEAGQSVFGENRVQELLAKAPALPDTAEWHFIGHLQKNKIRKILPLTTLIHGVDSVALARDIDRIAGELGLFPRVLLELNISGEGSKFGFRPEELRPLIEPLLTLPRIQVEGLMCIPPPTRDPEEVRPSFIRLRELRDSLARDTGTELPTLSMGMSGDFEVAISEGATLVRVGTAIFGDRRGNKA